MRYMNRKSLDKCLNFISCKGPFIYYVIQVGGRGGVSESMTHYDREGGGGMNNYDV